jgi:hypothetical protein
VVVRHGLGRSAVFLGSREKRSAITKADYSLTAHGLVQQRQASPDPPNPSMIGFVADMKRSAAQEVQTAQESDSYSTAGQRSSGAYASITDVNITPLEPPWIKEGVLLRRQYLKSAGKRCNDKTWSETFAVVSDGGLRMFTFNKGGGGDIIGSGNWLVSANKGVVNSTRLIDSPQKHASSAGELPLAHSLAHKRHPLGNIHEKKSYFVLSLACGAAYVFQAGTQELVEEWISTCNYWAARRSVEPLGGGVMNAEYGWNRVNDTRSRIDEWEAPIPCEVESAHDEKTQLDAMQKQLPIINRERVDHAYLQHTIDGLVGVLALARMASVLILWGCIACAAVLQPPEGESELAS